MERFGNASHDDIQKLMDKSKNNTTNAKATWMNVYHTWVKHRISALNIKSRTQKNLRNFATFFYGTEKTSAKKAVKRRRVIISGD